MSKRNFLSPVLLLVFLVGLPVSAFAGAQVSIATAGNGVFTLQGAGLQGVAGIQLAISYDATILSAPQVTLGNLVGERFHGVNVNANPMQIAVVDTVNFGGSGSGTIATVTFGSGTAAAGITGLSGTLIDQNSKAVAAQFTVVAPDPTAATADAQNGGTNNSSGGTASTPTTPTTAAVGTQPFVVGGTLTFPSAETQVKEKVQAVAQESSDRPAAIREGARELTVPPAEAGEEKAPAQRPVAQAIPAPAPVQSVLERFRLFQGEKTVKNLVALFSRESTASFSQSPAIAIADGTASVVLTISKVAGDRAPNFAFNSARYVSLTRVGDGEWEVEVRPEPGVLKASVSMLANGSLQEFPLTVTPKAEVLLSKAGEVSEADFLQFLKEPGTPAAPKHDLNKDGKRDYLDDYIFTANYLLKLAEKANKKKTTQQKPK